MKFIGGIFDSNKIKENLEKFTKEVEKEDLWNDSDNAKNVLKEFNNLKNENETMKKIQKLHDSVKLSLDETDDPDFLKLIYEDILELSKIVNEKYIDTLFTEKNDKSSCFLTVHCGSGGLESEDWARMLFEMYVKFANKHFKVDIIDYNSSDDGGIKNATIKISADKKIFPTGYMKSEMGVHRLVRISPYDKKKQRHTSFASVSVVPEIDDNIQITIDPSEVKIDTYKASGAGGQHVNKTESAIRITHIPTGVVVQCQNDRSQHKNKDEAFKMLKSRLYQKKLEELRKEKEELGGEKKEVTWGSQIRSYIQQPYQMVKDHRTDFEFPNFDKIVYEGEIEEFLLTYLKSLL